MSPEAPNLIGIAADHRGYDLEEYLALELREHGHEVIDFGDRRPKSNDDYPDFVVPLARAVAGGETECGLAICGEWCWDFRLHSRAICNLKAFGYSDHSCSLCPATPNHKALGHTPPSGCVT